MSEMPKKIYVPERSTEIAPLGLCGFWIDVNEDSFTAYIRADLVDGMRDALEAALEQLDDAGFGWTAAASLCEAALEAGKVDG